MLLLPPPPHMEDCFAAHGVVSKVDNPWGGVKPAFGSLATSPCSASTVALDYGQSSAGKFNVKHIQTYRTHNFLLSDVT